MSEVDELLRGYVENNDVICCAQWDPSVSERLRFDPYEYDAEAQGRAAHYFLLNAAVMETKLVGRAENARALMIDLHRRFKTSLYTETDPRRLHEAVRRSRFYRDYGRADEDRGGSRRRQRVGPRLGGRRPPGVLRGVLRAYGLGEKPRVLQVAETKEELISYSTMFYFF